VICKTDGSKKLGSFSSKMPHAGMPYGIERYFKDIKVRNSVANNLSFQWNQRLCLFSKHVRAWFVNTSGMKLVDKTFMCYLQGLHKIKQGGNVCSSARLM
jgi:hypothetical protein